MQQIGESELKALELLGQKGYSIPSASLNLGIRYEGFDVESEFNIYDVDTDKSEVHMIRKGSEDQPAAL